MQVTRLDLDGTGSPTGLVTKILKVETDLAIPVKIEELSYQLDISEIGELTTDGFEGGLITDDIRSVGGILVRKGANRHRRRFTIGHELGHFLLPFHKPVKAGEFLCSREAMRLWTANEQDRYARMEVEANQFAALMLMPPPQLRAFLAGMKTPDLANALAVHEHFDVSREAAARAYAQYQGEKIAIVVLKDAKILRIYRPAGFPELSVRNGQPAPRDSGFYIAPSAAGAISPMREIGVEHWLETKWAVRAPSLYEQVAHQSGGFAMLLLWAEIDDDDGADPEEGMTSKERYKDRMSRSVGRY